MRKNIKIFYIKKIQPNIHPIKILFHNILVYSSGIIITIHHIQTGHNVLRFFFRINSANHP